MKTIRIALAAAMLGGGTLVAPAAASADDDKITEYDFEDDLVRGDLVRPDGEILHARRRRPRTNLIVLRDNFVAELYKSIENL
jgi:hypothetical protein